MAATSKKRVKKTVRWANDFPYKCYNADDRTAEGNCLQPNLFNQHEFAMEPYMDKLPIQSTLRLIP